MQTVLVTGANGFIGNYLIESLANNYKVVATSRGNCRFSFSHDNLVYQSLDFTNQEDISKVFSNFQPSVVIHSGAISKPDDCELNQDLAYRINVTGTQLLINEAKKCKAFFIFISTDFVFDGLKGMYTEDDETSPVNYYGKTKLLAEEAVKNYTGDWAIVRTVLVYGHPGSGRQNLLTTVASSIQKGEEIKIFNDQVRTPTYVEDIAKAVGVIIHNRKLGLYHISGSDILTPYQMAVSVAEYLGLDRNLIQPVTEHDLKQPAKRPLKTGFNLAKAKKELQYSPTSFREGLSKTFT